MFKNEEEFANLISRLNIDAGPNSAHRDKLHLQMLSVFNETQQQPQKHSTPLCVLWRTIMKSPITKLAAAVLIVVVIYGFYRFSKPSMNSQPITQTGSERASEFKPINIKLPTMMFVGTRQDKPVPNLEKPTNKPRPPVLAPEGTTNVAAGKPVTSSDPEPIIGELKYITDGDKEASDGSYVELGPLKQYVTIDLQAMYEIYAIVVWHYHKEARVYYDVVVQIADDADFVTNVRTLFNNDTDNSAGLGIGKDMHYIETYEGKLIDAKGAKAHYVRLYSNRNTSDDLNHYIEVEVYGRPANWR
jgi:hypothetical protein